MVVPGGSQNGASTRSQTPHQDQQTQNVSLFRPYLYEAVADVCSLFIQSCGLVREGIGMMTVSFAPIYSFLFTNDLVSAD